LLPDFPSYTLAWRWRDQRADLDFAAKENKPDPVGITIIKLVLALVLIAKNGPVYTGIPYRNFFLFLDFIPALINIYYI
jgi:hypothetical protein